MNKRYRRFLLAIIFLYAAPLKAQTTISMLMMHEVNNTTYWICK